MTAASDSKVSQFLPPSIRNALVETQGWNKHARLIRINELTLQARKQYPALVRHPKDESRSSKWAEIRAGGSVIPDGGRIINDFDELN